MRRIILGLIFAFTAICFSGCKKAEEVTTEEPVSEAVVEPESTQAQVSEIKPSKPEGNPVSGYDSYETVELEKVEEADVPQISAKVEINTSHTAIDEKNYYQYSFLSTVAKQVYQVICESAKSGNTVVDLSTYRCTADVINNIYQAVIADNPQLFYLTKGYVYTYDSRKQTVQNVVLIYTDGSIEDKYDEKGNLVVAADRSKISGQISEFNNRVSEILGNIPAGVTAVEKEKLIYDYIQDTVTYDKNTAALLSNSSNVVSHSFGAYGAACKNLAVCEGYAELLQYLCYCVGINVTSVSGTASGGSHMWNAIQLDSKWYMLDATWDDSAQDGLHCYQYFNLTESEMSKDHNADSTNLHVPSCTSTEHAPYRYFALYIESTEAPPVNYEAVIDYLAETDESYLCVYAGNQSSDLQDYISKQIYSDFSNLQRYIRQKGYSISFDSRYYMVGNYYYILLK
ncbi:MAG: hypothetical protein IJZ53_02070 [Tyzzerella sp.]|nr:hypothetical protein [Tyzzerella sp.]